MIRIIAFDCVLDAFIILGRAHGPHAFGQPLVEPGFVELSAIAVVDHDVLIFQSRGSEAGDDLAENFGRRNHVRHSYRIHFDADHIARLDKQPPGIHPAIGAGERSHAAAHHVANRFGLILTGHDRSGMFHLHDTAAIQAGHGKLRALGFGRNLRRERHGNTAAKHFKTTASSRVHVPCLQYAFGPR